MGSAEDEAGRRNQKKWRTSALPPSLLPSLPTWTYEASAPSSPPPSSSCTICSISTSFAACPQSLTPGEGGREGEVLHGPEREGEKTRKGGGREGGKDG